MLVWMRSATSLASPMKLLRNSSMAEYSRSHQVDAVCGNNYIERITVPVTTFPDSKSSAELLTQMKKGGVSDNINFNINLV